MATKKNKSILSKDNELEPATAIGLNSVKNLIGNEKQLTLFDDLYLQEYSRTYGIGIEERIERFGVDLTDVQATVMEGILRGFSLTNYQGNMSPKERVDLIEERFAFGELPSIYNYIKKIPCLRATQAEILRWSGCNSNSIGEKERVLDALTHLGTRQYCFFYDRIALDEKRNPIKDVDGKWKQEEVMAVDTLFLIKEIRNKQNGNLDYYEIIPSPIFLDQKESNFMLVPYDWRKEVRAVVGGKASSYTFRFLMFLRFQYEIMKRSNIEEEKPFKITSKWEELAIALKMPESVFKRKKARALKILDDAYFVAKELGYLSEYYRNDCIDTLILNKSKYCTSEIRLCEEDRSVLKDFSVDVKDVWSCFNRERAKNDTKYKIKETPDVEYLNEFENILKLYSKEETINVIIWGLRLNVWHQRLNSPTKLRQNISEAIRQMSSSI